MALFEIKAFKCEWCGRIFESDKNYHDLDCKHDPGARTCVTCIFSSEFISNREIDAVYCPRKQEVFKYPNTKYCSEYKQNPNFESYKKS